MKGRSSGEEAYERVPSGKMKTDCDSVCIVFTAEEKAAREAVREARFMNTVFERATRRVLDWGNRKGGKEEAAY